MRQCSSDQGGGCLFTVSALGASPVGLNYYSLVLPSVLLTARADVTSEFLAGVICDTAKRFKNASSYPPYHDILQYNNFHYTTGITWTIMEQHQKSTPKTSCIASFTSKLASALKLGLACQRPSSIEGFKTDCERIAIGLYMSVHSMVQDARSQSVDARAGHLSQSECSRKRSSQPGPRCIPSLGA
jgi:hypothetical protein